MLNKSNIDKLFIDKLKSFQASPDEKVWQKIERKLKKKKQKKRDSYLVELFRYCCPINSWILPFSDIG